MLHATEALHYFHATCYISIPRESLRLKPMKRLEEGNDALIITKKTTKLSRWGMLKMGQENNLGTKSINNQAVETLRKPLFSLIAKSGCRPLLPGLICHDVLYR